MVRDELERMWNEALVTFVRYYANIPVWRRVRGPPP
jgi:hypothetical protein